MEGLRLAEPGLLEGIEAESPYVVSELAVTGAGQEEAAPVLQLLAGDPRFSHGARQISCADCLPVLKTHGDRPLFERNRGSGTATVD